MHLLCGDLQKNLIRKLIIHKRSLIFGIKLKLELFLWCLCRCLVHYLPPLTSIFLWKPLFQSQSFTISNYTCSCINNKQQNATRSNPGAWRKNGHKGSLFPFYRPAPHCSDAGGGFVQLETETLSRENRIGDAQKAKSQWLAVIIAKKRSNRLRSRRQIAGGQHKVV